jgi:phosphatidylserine/phosphatidylglycerophosphate/cardiolipin synthase-like enzyme
MGIPSPRLLEQIHRTILCVPPTVLHALIVALQGSEQISSAGLRFINPGPTPEFRKTINELVEVWQHEDPVCSPQAIAFALAGASNSYQRAREQTAIELVWTGPTTSAVPLRRTEQVLLDMIRESRRDLLIVSFAVYNIAGIVAELEHSLARGVALTIVAETPESSQGKVGFNAEAAFNGRIKREARILIWPYTKREKDADGRHGSLHAKCAVADRETCFVSSANLTQYALNLNMEMGLRVNDKALAEKIVRHIEALTQNEVLMPAPI